ncbi:histone deacetylase Clr3 [Schizosaccharomyces japonicus yFS275]|uniref:Histone deacetylase n=1 Tax=Schizosaccharomyces japonicus (strain yFS275 / FY16936) TaxID=402676 RepID=B6K575_SCHJY|nr:histone deacetylase Clr3 [Schizosaccharomyces japonicus yFS275]EEB08679.1 histone deacetylase Clr3 [Schizosaccharomyces japonicus yFS275]
MLNVPPESEADPVATVKPSQLMLSKEVPAEVGHLDSIQDKDVEEQKPDVLNMKSGLCYDPRMRFHATLDEVEDHPEDPRRILQVFEAIKEAGYVSAIPTARDAFIRIPSREATLEEILRVHSKDVYDMVKSSETMSREELVNLEKTNDSLYFNNQTFFCARLASGSAVETCNAVVNGKVKNAFAIIRPPGHHSEPNKSGGFCLFNNVAITARSMMARYPEQVKRVLILDWDVHHGNGTQMAFYDDPNVLYISLHRYENGRFYPGTTYGSAENCGEGEGLGKTVNIPWPCAGMSDGDYIYAFQKVVMPIGYEFNPDLVIISAGFDAAAGDPLGQCYLTPAAYAHMTQMLLGLAEGKLFVSMEGGYSLSSISTAGLAVAQTLLGIPPAKLHTVYATAPAVKTVEEVTRIQSRYWKCMRPIFHTPPTDYTHVNPLHEVVRAFQAKKLFDNWQMTILPISRDGLSESYANQALCSNGFFHRKTLVLFVHDPPDVLGSSQGNSNLLNLSQSAVVDYAETYIDWCLQQDFGLIDINVPELLTDADGRPYSSTEETKLLCLYIWDNYIELSSAEKIIFIGEGRAVPGLIHLVSSRNVSTRVKSVITFVGTDALCGIKTISNEDVPSWYYKHSLVLVSNGNVCWKKMKRKKKRYGRLVRTEHDHKGELMQQHYESIVQYMEKILRQ